MVTPNLFIALEIDPDKPWSQADFERKLQKNIHDWSKAKTTSLAAEINSACIDTFKQIASDEEKRKAEALAARQLRNEKLRARRQEFETRVKFWGLKGHLWQSEFDYLVKEFKDILTEDQIRREVKVPLKTATSASPKPSVPTIDGSTMKALGERLHLLEVETLYQFLEKFSNATLHKANTTLLQQASSDLYKLLQPMSTKNVVSRVATELASAAKDIFKSDEQRAKYDETLRLQRYDEIKEKIKWLGVAKKVELVQFQALLEEAKRAKFNLAEIEQLIFDQATKSSWLIVSPETEKIKTAVQQQQLCGYCQHLNDPTARDCRWCRRPLQSPCPKCGQIQPSMERTCGKCNFPLGNRPFVEWLLHEAEHGTEAAKWLTQAQAHWPASANDPLAQKITTLLSQIAAEQEKQTKLRTQIETKIQQKRFYAAQMLLPQLQAILPAEVSSYKVTIEAEIKKVEAKLSQPLPADSEQRLLFYQTVQAMCHDALSNTIDQKIATLEGEINERKQEEIRVRTSQQQAEATLRSQLESAFQQRRYYAARQLLPQAERLLPGKLSEYRRLVEDNIKQAEELLTRQATLGDLTKRLELYQQVQTICADALGDTLAQKIKELQNEISSLNAQQSKLTQQMAEAIKQNRWYEAQRLLPELVRLNVPAVAEYRRQTEANLKQVETKLTQANGSDPEKTVALAREILQLCADCQPAKELLTKTLPSPPMNLQAQVHGQIIQLTWQASPCREAKYIIMRKKQARPTSLQDGEKLATVTGTLYDDKTAEVGVPTFYTVFADREGVISKDTATLKQPVMRLQELLQVRSQVDQQRVQLSWQLPPNCQQVMVRRDVTKPPETIQAGYGVSVLQNREAVDRQVSDGQRYFYRLFAAFKDYNGQLITTPGTVVEVTPTRPPEPITDLVITSTGPLSQPQLQLSWSNPAQGLVGLIKASQPTGLTAGEMMPQTDLGRYGELLSTTANTLTLSVIFGTHYFCPVIVLQGQAYIGQEKSYTLSKPSRLTLEYEVVKATRQLHVMVRQGAGELPALQVRHHPQQRPTRLEGQLILTLPPQLIEKLEFWFPLPREMRSGWIDLFLENTALYELVTIRRPTDDKLRV